MSIQVINIRVDEQDELAVAQGLGCKQLGPTYEAYDAPNNRRVRLINAELPRNWTEAMFRQAVSNRKQLLRK
jgi:hypothetical protein